MLLIPRNPNQISPNGPPGPGETSSGTSTQLSVVAINCVVPNLSDTLATEQLWVVVLRTSQIVLCHCAALIFLQPMIQALQNAECWLSRNFDLPQIKIF